MMHYLRYEEVLTDLMVNDFVRFVPEVLRLLVQQGTLCLYMFLGNGSSTGSMSAVSGLLGLVFGSSLTAQGAVIGLASFTGKCATHTAFRTGLLPRLNAHSLRYCCCSRRLCSGRPLC